MIPCACQVVGVFTEEINIVEVRNEMWSIVEQRLALEFLPRFSPVFVNIQTGTKEKLSNLISNDL